MNCQQPCRPWMTAGVIALIVAGWLSVTTAAEPPIDFERARQLLQKERAGQTLTTQEQEYVQRAREERRKGRGAQGRPPRVEPRPSTGLVPLCDMSAEERYQGEDGGLYGGGGNAPPEEHRQAAERVLAQIRPLDAQGRPATDGRIVLVSISMSNATQEFSRFRHATDSHDSTNERFTSMQHFATKSTPHQPTAGTLSPSNGRHPKTMLTPG